MYKSWRKKAVDLRKKGYSYNLIRERIPVSKSTLSYWLSEIPFKPNAQVKARVKSGFLRLSMERHEQRINQIARIKREAKNFILPFSERDMLLFGLGLYLGEGAKLSQRVRMINSDPRVISFAVLWLEKHFDVPRKNMSLTIHLYPDNQLKKSLKYWSKITKIPVGQFRKTQIDLRKNKSGKKHRKLPYGTAHLEVNCHGRKGLGVELFRRIICSIDEVFENCGILRQE